MNLYRVEISGSYRFKNDNYVDMIKQVVAKDVEKAIMKTKNSF